MMVGDEDFKSTRYTIDRLIGSGASSVVWYVGDIFPVCNKQINFYFVFIFSYFYL